MAWRSRMSSSRWAAIPASGVSGATGSGYYYKNSPQQIDRQGKPHFWLLSDWGSR